MIRIDLRDRERKKHSSAMSTSWKQDLIIPFFLLLSVAPHFIVSTYRSMILSRHQNSMAQIQAHKKGIEAAMLRMEVSKKENEGYERQIALAQERLQSIQKLLQLNNASVSVLDSLRMQVQ